MGRDFTENHSKKNNKIKIFWLLKRLRSPQYAVLTTFPEKTSGNVGDKLLYQSFLWLLEKEVGPTKIHLIFRSEYLSNYHGLLQNCRAIIMPGFSIAPGSYPKFYPLTDNLSDLPCPIIPIASSLQAMPGEDPPDKSQYDNRTFSLIKNISEKIPYFSGRDEIVTSTLKKLGVTNSLNTGDCALFETGYFSKPFHQPASVSTICFTTPHHAMYESQAVLLLQVLAKNFPYARRYIVFHSRRNRMSQRIFNNVSSLGYEGIDAHGSIDTIRGLYNASDCHIGYRLHGHIANLRWRRPSILLMEDIRGKGLSTVIPEGCFQPWTKTQNGHIVADEDAPRRAIDFLMAQVSSKFSAYKITGTKIDDLYKRAMLPMIRSIF